MVCFGEKFGNIISLISSAIERGVLIDVVKNDQPARVAL